MLCTDLHARRSVTTPHTPYYPQMRYIRTCTFLRSVLSPCLLKHNVERHQAHPDRAHGMRNDYETRKVQQSIDGRKPTCGAWNV